MTGPRNDSLWRDRLIIAAAYAIAWGLLLVNRGLYWDDWTLLGRTPASLIGGFTELGLPLGGVAYSALFSLPLPGLAGHVLIFATYLASSLVLHAILRLLPGISAMDALIAALTFAVLPVNVARIALIDSLYGVSLLAFLLASWLLIRVVEDGGTGRRIAALLLFLLSFYTASLLVFYAVPIALAAFLLRRARSDSIASLVIRHADFLALPVAYWVLKAAFLTPNGVYEGYNALSLGGLLGVPGAMIAVPGQVLAEPMTRAFAVAGWLGLVAGAGLAIVLLRHRRRLSDARPAPAPILALIGAALIGLGVFAYLAVGLTPMIWDWSSRHQLLVPLGVGLIAAAIGRGFGSLGSPTRTAGLAVVGLLLGISVIADVRTLVGYQVDWFKQQALIEAVRADPALQTARHVRVNDAATALNALRRTYRFYELNAMFEEGTGTRDRLVALRGREPAEADLESIIDRPAYHMGDYVRRPVDLDLRIAPGDPPHLADVLTLLWLEATGSPSFRPEVSRLVNLSVSGVTGAP
ncbi:MAG: hypothetical protein ABI553_09680 [Chloroflexota bacterium]